MNDYNRLLEVLRTRRSIRRFSERAVTREVLGQLWEAARWAPSNLNRQPWRFLVIEDKQKILQLAETVRQRLKQKLEALPAKSPTYAGDFNFYATCFDRAPVILVVLHKQPAGIVQPLLAGIKNPELISGEPLSVAMSVQNLLLAAHTLRLGTCVLTGLLLAQDVLAAALNLPAGYNLTCLVALGYPAESPTAPRRKAVEQMVEYQNGGELSTP